jgi:hypothetical protein
MTSWRRQRVQGFNMRHRGFFLAAGLAVTAIGALPADANVLITVDKSTQEMTVQVDGATRWQWKVSTGRLGHDTPNGSFHALSMEVEHFSKKYDDAPMPHSIFFTDLGHAIHGSLAASRIGTPASHGCVRLDPKNATALFALVKQEGRANTTIVVTGSAAVALARKSAPAARPAAPVVTARTIPVPQPSYVPPSGSFDDGAANAGVVASRFYRQPDAQPAYQQAFIPQYAGPPAPPPGYPPFPTPGAAFGSWR